MKQKVRFLSGDKGQWKQVSSRKILTGYSKAYLLLRVLQQLSKWSEKLWNSHLLTAGQCPGWPASTVKSGLLWAWGWTRWPVDAIDSTSYSMKLQGKKPTILNVKEKSILCIYEVNQKSSELFSHQSKMEISDPYSPF